MNMPFNAAALAPLSLDMALDALRHSAARVLDELRHAEIVGTDLTAARRSVARIAAELDRHAVSSSSLTEPVCSFPPPRPYGV